MYYTTDQDLIEDFHLRSGHSVGSKKSYRTVFNKYTAFHNMSLCDLLAEAITEQENHTPENRLSIYDRIISFRDYLIENHIGSTIANSISKIKTFYHYNRVTLPFIPPLNNKYIIKNNAISFEDLPTKDELRLALKFADDNLKLWILVMISSGTTRCEAKSMTNQTFFEGTKAYHKKDNFQDAMKYLTRKNNVVCTCKLIRQKTDKPYYTFLNPECVQKIAKVKLKQEDFDLTSPLLKHELNHVNYKFKKLNEYLGFGEAGGFARLRPHMLRKFNSTYLNQGSLDGDLLAMDSVDMLHGRGKNKTREVYYKDNPDFLKLEYIKVMSNISLYRRYDWKIVNGKVKVISKPL
jgi:hypothetical protein